MLFVLNIKSSLFRVPKNAVVSLAGVATAIHLSPIVCPVSEVITKETPIKVAGNKRVEFEDAELKTSFEEKPLYTILDALISANTNE